MKKLLLSLIVLFSFLVCGDLGYPPAKCWNPGAEAICVCDDDGCRWIWINCKG